VVVLPTYNEIGNLETIADALLRLALSDAAPLRLLIVDDASTDGTAEAADALARRHRGRVEVLHRAGKRGLGSAYLAGFAQALDGRADLIVQMDADLSHDPAALGALIAAARDADLVIGSRYVAGGSVDTSWGWHRKWLSRFANRGVVPTLLALPLSDATGGYRVWRRETLARIAPAVTVHSSGYGFQVEMAYLAHRLGGRIREIPIHFRQRTAGRSKMSGVVALTAIMEIFAVRARPGTPRAACGDSRREIST
jgi:dolichol-phosphate mannosyltransferase